MNFSKPSILIVAGEASGDMHGAALVREMRVRRPDLAFFGIGGDRMAEAGVEILYHAKDLAFLGFTEVVRHYPFIRRVFRDVTAAARERKPAGVVLIDYPGFNLKLAEALHRDLPVVYYISPQVWAWGKGRVKRMAPWIRLMMTILPFEAEIYEKAGIPVKFVGHPLKDAVKPSMSREDFLASIGLKPSGRYLALVPGSRRQEIAKLLPVMIEAHRLLIREVPDLSTVLAMAPTLDDADYTPFLNQSPEIIPVRDRTHDVMAHAEAVLVCSGTATLETALVKAPMVVMYQMSPVSYALGKMLVKIENIGLVNIVAGKRIVPELVQDQVNPPAIRDAVLPFIRNAEPREKIVRDLAAVSERLGEAGASGRAAESALEVFGL